MIGAWLVHLYTASGFILAFLATEATIDHDYRRAFLFLWLQVVVDATDGWLARAANVTARLPWFSGSKLDDLVDYLAYVVVPALMVWHGMLVPAALATPVACAMLVSSGFGFSRLDAKTSDHFFTGFPSYWNVVVLYLVELGWPPWTNAVLLLGLALMPLPAAILPPMQALPIFILFLILVPMGTALLFPASTSLVSQRTDRHELGLVMGAQQTFRGIVSIVGPVVATVAFAGLGHGVPLLLAASIVALAAVLAFRERPHQVAATA